MGIPRLPLFMSMFWACAQAERAEKHHQSTERETKTVPSQSVAATEAKAWKLLGSVPTHPVDKWDFSPGETRSHTESSNDRAVVSGSLESSAPFGKLTASGASPMRQVQLHEPPEASSFVRVNGSEDCKVCCVRHAGDFLSMMGNVAMAAAAVGHTYRVLTEDGSPESSLVVQVVATSGAVCAAIGTCLQFGAGCVTCCGAQQVATVTTSQGAPFDEEDLESLLNRAFSEEDIVRGGVDSNGCPDFL
eukprot:CAMPEP_0172676092 /NCGR_PEP_ID=MMETSP1074-20121228/13718_1 /TAXON_ID=2916 /ORGANISM="Ceratium fusus, Strain PA161109" /LENGTH=246 /DNA_ID=CAMNT_0013493663 /DNA_START=65 /DNA_END=805 /DNA_ORIENTATION=-